MKICENLRFSNIRKSSGFSNKTLAAILALGAFAFGCVEEKQPKKELPKLVDVLIIDNKGCKDVCGGEICYGNIIHTLNGERGSTVTKIKVFTGYSISYSGFDSFDTIGERFILADECIFYKKSAGSIELVLERLR